MFLVFWEYLMLLGIMKLEYLLLMNSEFEISHLIFILAPAWC